MSLPAPQRKQVSQSILNKIAMAEPTAARRPNIRDGAYLFEIVNVLSEEMRKGHCFIVELGVVEARATDDPTRATITPNAVGTQAGQVINFSGGGADAAPGNVKRLILGLLGIDEDKMEGVDPASGVSRLLTTDEKVEAIKATYADLTSEEQPGRGMLIRGSTFTSEIKSGPNKGKLFVGVNWEFVPNQTDASIAARRALIDSGKFGTPLQ